MNYMAHVNTQLGANALHRVNSFRLHKCEMSCGVEKRCHVVMLFFQSFSSQKYDLVLGICVLQTHTDRLNGLLHFQKAHVDAE
jgi:hypothetical protein